MGYPKYSEYQVSGIDLLGNIPNHWNTIRLKFLVDCFGGGTPATENSEYWNGDIPWVSPKDMKSMYIQNTQDFITEEGLHESTAAMVPAETLLIVVRSGILKHSIPVALAKVPLSLNQDMKGLVCNKLIYPNYLSFYIHGCQKNLLHGWRKLGCTVESIESDLMLNNLVPLPPIDEQKKISDFLCRKVDELDVLITQKQQLIKKLNDKRISLITKAVTKGLDPSVPMKNSGIDWLGQVPAHWHVLPLKFLAQIRTGATKGRDLGKQKTVRLPYMRVANVQDGFITTSDIANIEVAEEEVGRFMLQKGDILMNEGGDNDKVGRGAVWHGEIEPCLHQNHVFAVRPEHESFSSWIGWVIQSQYAKFYFYLKANQSTNLASISATNLKKLPVTLPDADERRAIEAYLERELHKMNESRSVIEQAIKKLQQYRTALITAAVTGKIDVRQFELKDVA